MGFDIRTVIAATALSMLVVSVAMSITAKSYPAHFRRAALRWAVASGVQGVGWILLGFRNTLPDVMTIVLANVLLAYASTMYYLSIKDFEREHVSRLAYVPVALVLVSFVYLGLVAPSYVARVVIISVVGALQFGACGVVLLRKRDERPRPAARFTGWAFILCIPILVVRAVSAIVGSPTGLFEATYGQAVSFLFIFVAEFVVSFGFLLMCNEAFTSELVRLATLDPLTERLNRRMIEEHARREIARARREGAPLSVALVDIDHFKQVNDSFGHLVGDAVLRSVASRMSSGLRAQDQLGRYGGEEFLVVMPNTDIESALAAADRLRREVARTPFEVEDRRIPLTTSVGIASSAGADLDLEDLLRRADAALYSAKGLGRNRVSRSSAPWREDAAGD